VNELDGFAECARRCQVVARAQAHDEQQKKATKQHSSRVGLLLFVLQTLLYCSERVVLFVYIALVFKFCYLYTIRLFFLWLQHNI
jgi:hypothetical protein